MLIGEGDISNVVISLGTCLSMLIYIRARFRFALIGGNLKAQSTGSHRKLDAEFKFQRRSCKLSFLFPTRRQRTRRACSQAMINKDVRVLSCRDVILSHTMQNALNFVISQYCIKRKTRLVKIQINFFYVPFVSD